MLTRLLAAVFILLILPTAAPAFSVAPLILELETVGPTARGTIQVTNTQPADIPISITVMRASLDENGGVSESPAGSDLTIFPLQAIIKPGRSQNFRVQWAGSQIPVSQSYAILVKRAAVQLQVGKSGINVVNSFQIIANVAPPQSIAKMSVLQSGLATDGKVLRPAVTVVNNGTRHAKLSDYPITISGSGWSRQLDAATLRQSLGVALIEPKKRRRFVLPTTVPAGSGNLIVRLGGAALASAPAPLSAGE